MLVVIIAGRWLLPKGDLSREQLSALLLSYAATASDIVDFFGITDEDHFLKENSIFVYSVLTLWTWSLMQFPFVLSMQTKSENYSDDEEEESESERNFKHKPRKGATEGEKSTPMRRIERKIQWLLQTEGWGICLSLFLQDFPFLIVRLITAFKYKVLTESNYFFISKNALTLFLQMYRLYSLYQEHVETVKREKDRKRQFIMNSIYRRAFVSRKVGNSPKSQGSFHSPDLGIDYNDAKELKHVETQFLF